MRLLLAAALVAAALAGCGEDEPTGGPAPAPTPTATAATPTGTPTPLPETGGEEPTPESPEDQPGGAGDEEEVRVPVELKIRDRGISPTQVSVPAFLALELIVHNETGGEVVVRLEGAEPLTVLPGETGRARLEGRRKGEYTIDAGDAGQAMLVSGAEAGP